MRRCSLLAAASKRTTSRVWHRVVKVRLARFRRYRHRGTFAGRYSLPLRICTSKCRLEPEALRILKPQARITRNFPPQKMFFFLKFARKCFFSFLLEEFQKTGHLSFSKYCKLTLQTSTIDPSSMQGSALANFRTCGSQNLQILKLQASALIDRLNNFTIRTLNSKFKVANFKTSSSDLQMLRLQASAFIDRLSNSQFEP